MLRVCYIMKLYSLCLFFHSFVAALKILRRRRLRVWGEERRRELCSDWVLRPGLVRDRRDIAGAPDWDLKESFSYLTNPTNSIVDLNWSAVSSSMLLFILQKLILASRALLGMRADGVNGSRVIGFVPFFWIHLRMCSRSKLSPVIVISGCDIGSRDIGQMNSSGTLISSPFLLRTVEHESRGFWWTVMAKIVCWTQNDSRLIIYEIAWTSWFVLSCREKFQKFPRSFSTPLKPEHSDKSPGFCSYWNRVARFSLGHPVYFCPYQSYQKAGTGIGVKNCPSGRWRTYDFWYIKKLYLQ